jgi:hypothetical protein
MSVIGRLDMTVAASYQGCGGCLDSDGCQQESKG